MTGFFTAAEMYSIHAELSQINEDDPKMTQDNFNESTQFQYQTDPKRLNFMVLGCDS